MTSSVFMPQELGSARLFWRSFNCVGASAPLLSRFGRLWHCAGHDQQATRIVLLTK